MTYRVISVFLTILLITSAFAPVAIASPQPSQSVNSDTILISYEVSVSEKNESELVVTANVQLPSQITRFKFTERPTGFEFQDSNGFDWSESSKELSWNGRSSPSVTYTVPAKQAGNFDGLSSAAQDGWAFVTANDIDMKFRYWYQGESPQWQEQYEVKGTGFAGVSVLYIGNHTIHGNASEGFRVIMPNSTDSSAPPEAIMTTLTSSKQLLTVGASERVVNVFVAPDPIRGGGLAPWTEINGEQDVWVHHSSTASDSASNTYIHEYVHTRQDFSLSNDMQWFTEGSADYYAGLLALHQNESTFTGFHSRMNQSPENPVDLTKHESLTGQQYTQGRHLLAILDAKIRNESDGRASLMDVFQRMNSHQGSVSLVEFKQFASEASGEPQVAGWIEKYVSSKNLPPVPDEHQKYIQVTDGDSDKDGLSDNREIEVGTKPFDAFSDSDNLRDGEEVDQHQTSPFMEDTDSDGLNDDVEVDWGSDPSSIDSDGDSISDEFEYISTTSPQTPTSLAEYTVAWIKQR